MKPGFINSIRDQQGHTVYQDQPEDKRAIDPRVAYLMVNMMEEVLRTGTGAGVRGRGFKPAGGRQDRDLPRWVVCGLHVQADLRGVGGLRR